MKIWSVLLLALLSCTHDKPAGSQPVLEVPPVLHSPTAPITEKPSAEMPQDERHFTIVEQNGYYFVKFDRKKLPPNTFYIEATYGESYLGYFVIGDTIALLKPKEGRNVFLYYALDGLGNRLQEEPFKATLP
jgi:hypothetical protein